MGETRAGGEGTIGGFLGEGVHDVKDDYLPFAPNFGYLNSFGANKLKYVHGKAFGYKICKLSIIPEEALVTEKMNGETKYGF
jgi:hypothetical protein